MLVSDMVRKMKSVKKFDIDEDCVVRGSTLDSRLASDGIIFFAVKGEQLDGNDYAQAALDAKAAAVIMNDAAQYEKVKGNKILVDDTVVSMKALGKQRFADSKALKIAVTGSFGKTGTKEAIKNIFAKEHKVYATIGNKNNELGVTLTGSGIDDDAEVLVIEIGSNASGEIRGLSFVVNPDIAVVISIGHAHIGRFGSLEKVIEEKLSIAEGLKKGGTLIIPHGIKQYVRRDDIKVVTFGRESDADVRMTDVKHHGMYISFRIAGECPEYWVNHPYLHIVENSLAAIAAAQIRGIKPDSIAQGLLTYSPSEGHGNVIELKEFTIINDTYNAGFESFVRAAESLEMMNNNPKYAIFGEMGEIEGFESTFYNEIAALADKYPSITFILCGTLYENIKNTANRRVFRDKAQVISILPEIKSGVILVKASNAKKFGDIVTALAIRGGRNAK